MCLHAASAFLLPDAAAGTGDAVKRWVHARLVSVCWHAACNASTSKDNQTQTLYATRKSALSCVCPFASAQGMTPCPGEQLAGFSTRHDTHCCRARRSLANNAGTTTCMKTSHHSLTVHDCTDMSTWTDMAKLQAVSLAGRHMMLYTGIFRTPSIHFSEQRLLWDQARCSDGPQKALLYCITTDLRTCPYGMPTDKGCCWLEQLTGGDMHNGCVSVSLHGGMRVWELTLRYTLCWLFRIPMNSQGMTRPWWMSW